jgi:hypothetical protein
VLETSDSVKQKTVLKNFTVRKLLDFKLPPCSESCVLSSAYEDGTECSKTSAYKIQTPRNYPEESIKQLEGYRNKYVIIFFNFCLL